MSTNLRQTYLPTVNLVSELFYLKETLQKAVDVASCAQVLQVSQQAKITVPSSQRGDMYHPSSPFLMGICPTISSLLSRSSQDQCLTTSCFQAQRNSSGYWGIALVFATHTRRKSMVSPLSGKRNRTELWEKKVNLLTCSDPSSLPHNLLRSSPNESIPKLIPAQCAITWDKTPLCSATVQWAV